MEDVGADIFFKLLNQALDKRTPDIDMTLPSFDELRNNVTQIHASRSPEVLTETESEPALEPGVTTPVSEKATAAATGCVPCSIGHLGTCSGLLNEAMRFAHNDGVQSGEVIERVNMCLDELNALERVDLRPEMIHGLPPWERNLADRALSLSRAVRHDLEQISDTSSLEGVAARTQTERQEIGKEWFRGKLERMNPEQRAAVEKKLQERAAAIENQG